MKEFNLKGQLKPLKWFLDNYWWDSGDYIEDLLESFVITYEELESELNLKEITDSICNLELEDENGTQYMRDWFGVLEENI
jgi:hypothetical protein